MESGEVVTRTTAQLQPPVLREGAELLADHEGMELHGRLYRPRPEILNGSWKFPEAKAGRAIKSGDTRQQLNEIAVSDRATLRGATQFLRPFD